MIQLVKPNLATKGRIGYCLEFVNDSINTPQSQRLPCATDAWNKTKFRHLDMNFPPDVIVPVWFSYFANIGGVYKDWGHVCWHDPKLGFVSSPWRKGTSKAVIGSLSELIRIYSDNGANPMKLLGWSEDISNVRVVKEDEMYKGHDAKYWYDKLQGSLQADAKHIKIAEDRGKALEEANKKLASLGSQTVLDPTTKTQLDQINANVGWIKALLSKVFK